MDGLTLDFLPPGPLRAWVLILVAGVVATTVTLAVHALGATVMRRIAGQRPLPSHLTAKAYRPAQVALVLLGWRMVVAGAPPEVPYVESVAYLLTIALIVALTWLVLRAIDAVASTVIQLHPYDVADNLKARRILTQTRVLARSAQFIVLLLGFSFVLLTLPGARQVGASLLASAGVAGLVAGIAARPVLGNFIAGLQIALSQPIRIDDVLIVQGEWGRVEEITGTFVVVRIWDQRRMIVPLQWFIENPFENWTHRSASLLGTVFLWLDFGVPVAALRQEFERVCKGSQLWDGRVCVLQITDATDRAMQVRMLVSARDSGQAFDLRCLVREAMIAFVAQRHPYALPRLRAEWDDPQGQGERGEQDTGPAPGSEPASRVQADGMPSARSDAERDTPRSAAP